MIRLDEVSRTFHVGGRPVHALREVDLHLAAGGYASIMGPSGSGKSTLLNLLGCLDRPTSGTYALDGQDVSRLDEAALTQVRRHKIGFVFQSFHLVPRLTAAGNVELPMIFAGVESARRR
jgi:putative ABC transport system ATP-binding protein